MKFEEFDKTITEDERRQYAMFKYHMATHSKNRSLHLHDFVKELRTLKQKRKDDTK